MFVGHFAPALVAATHKQAPSLPILFIGAQLVDWVFFGLVQTGAEAVRIIPGFTAMNPMDLHHMPWTHSLVGSIGWGVAFALVLVAFNLASRAGAAIAAAVVVSHWFIDLLVHVPDLTLTGQPPKLGLGLWNHPALAMGLEAGLTLAALWWFAKRTGRGGAPLLVLAVTLALLQAINWFGPPPEVADWEFSLMAWLGYGVATLAAWWAVRKPIRP